MSQEGIIDVVGSNPQIPTDFICDVGNAVPIANTLEVLGTVVAAGTHPFRSVGSGNIVTYQVQVAQAIAASNATNIGLSAFNSADFTVDANGFVTLSGAGATETLTGNSGGAVSPTSNNINTLGTGSITIAGNPGTSTLTTQLTGLTNHAIQIGAGTATLTQLGPTATAGQILQSAGAAADPAFSTATYPSTTTINQLLYSSSNNVVAGLAAANRAVYTSGATGIPVATALATNGQLIIGSTAGVPSAALLTAGTGISITNASNSITIAVNGSVVGQTITGTSGGALSPTAGNWNILGASTVAGTTPVSTSGSVSTLTINVQKSQAIASTNATNVGLSAFDSAHFTVDSNGFVSLLGTGALETLTGNSGGVISPTAGNINTLGTGSITIVGSGSTLTTQLTGLTNHAVLVGAGSATITNLSVGTNGQVLVGATTADPAFATLTSSDSSISFTTGANTLSLQVAGGTTTIKTITGNTGGAESPSAGNFNILGTGSITVAGSANTETVQLTGLTNHAIQIGAGTATLTQLGAGTTGQVLQTNTTADPTWSTATYPSTTTVSQLLYSSATNTVAGLSTANQGVLTTGATGIPVITALATNGQLIIGSTAGVPAAATLTAGTGISITNGSNSISIAVNGSVVGQTITGNSGGALSPTAGNWNTLGTGSITIAGSGSTLTTQLTGLTNHAVLVGAGTATITNLGVGTNGQVLIGATTADPAFATLTSSDSSISFTTGANTLSLQVAGGTTTIKTITGNSGGAESPSAGNFNILGTGSITVAGTANTETVQLTGLTNHNVLIGAGTATITNVAPSATSGVPLISQGSSSDPTFGTAVVAGGGTGVTSATAYAVLCGGTTTTGAFQSVAALGSSGQALVSNGAGALPTFQTVSGTGFSSIVIQTFTASGTYTPTANMKYCQIQVIGGGGGGGGAGATTGAQYSVGGGGGAGESAVGIFSAATIGASQTVTIGAAGAGNSGAAGGNGGTTSVGALITAVGSNGGTIQVGTTGGFAVGQIGGTGGTGGSYRSQGQPGHSGCCIIGTAQLFSGSGGSSPIGSGGVELQQSSAAGNAAAGYGSGGGGASNATSQSARAGGAGTAGIVIVTEYI